MDISHALLFYIILHKPTVSKNKQSTYVTIKMKKKNVARFAQTYQEKGEWMDEEVLFVSYTYHEICKYILVSRESRRCSVSP